jgi:hypothetical protein
MVHDICTLAMIWVPTPHVLGSSPLHLPTHTFELAPTTCCAPACTQLAGASHFRAVAAETKEVYAYVFSNAAGTPTHVLAWRPVAVGDSETAANNEAVQFDVGFASAASAAYALNGAAPSGSAVAALPGVSGSTWSMQLSGIPTMVVLSG